MELLVPLCDHVGMELLVPLCDHVGMELLVPLCDHVGMELLVPLCDHAGMELLAPLHDHTGMELLVPLCDHAGMKLLAPCADPGWAEGPRARSVLATPRVSGKEGMLRTARGRREDAAAASSWCLPTAATSNIYPASAFRELTAGTQRATHPRKGKYHSKMGKELNFNNLNTPCSGRTGRT